jgi:hypothetical protein
MIDDRYDVILLLGTTILYILFIVNSNVGILLRIIMFKLKGTELATGVVV